MALTPPGDFRSVALLSLADELLLCIIEQIDSRKDLCALAATCAHLQRLTEPFIWESIFIRTGTQAVNTSDNIVRRNERLSAVQDVAICYVPHPEETDIASLNAILPRLVKLRHLNIESPCPNNDGERRYGVTNWSHYCRIDYTSLFESSINPTLDPPVLSMLQSVTLHGHGRGRSEFKFGRNAAIFLHPALRNLKIACSDFEAGFDLAKIPQGKLKSTALEALHFDECNIDVNLLHAVLGLPRALKVLSIGERLYAFDGCQPTTTLGSNHTRFLNALRQQADSLEEIRHIGGICVLPDPKDLDEPDQRFFYCLKNLRRLALGFESVLRICLLKGGISDSVKHLMLYDTAWAIPNDSPLLHAQQAMDAVTELAVKAPLSIQNVSVCFTYVARSAPPDTTLRKIWCSQRQREKVYKIARHLNARGSRFRVFGHVFEGDKSYIPPYLYEEQIPQEVLMYDSSDLWVFRARNYRDLDDEDYDGSRDESWRSAMVAMGEQELQEYLLQVQFFHVHGQNMAFLQQANALIHGIHHLQPPT